jgi:uncharacterized protein YegP (UPF0339 family)
VKVEIFKGVTGVWFWRVRARNGKIVADGAESYANRSSVKRAVKAFLKQMAAKAETIKIWEIG